MSVQTRQEYIKSKTMQKKIKPGSVGKSKVLFTGPDGIRDHEVHVETEHRFVGEGTMSPEGTSDATYLWRSPIGAFTPRPKSTRVGEIGYPVYRDCRPFTTGHQITLGEFRQAVEDGHTHLYQNAWYPGPGEEVSENSDAAYVMNVYRTRPKTSQRT